MASFITSKIDILAKVCASLSTLLRPANDLVIEQQGSIVAAASRATAAAGPQQLVADCGDIFTHPGAPVTAAVNHTIY